MISHEPHPLLGDDIEARTARIERSAQKQRERNRENLIPDMEPAPHEPVEWFAEVGFHSLLDGSHRSTPDYDWSEELDSEARCVVARQDYLDARKRDVAYVLETLRTAEISPIAGSGARFGDAYISWPDRIPGLKTWAGRQTLPGILQERKNFLPHVKIEGFKVESFDIMGFTAPVAGTSGFDRRVGSARTALENGFSVDAIMMRSETRVCMELLAVIGLEKITIACEPDRSFVYEAGGKRWRFRREKRSTYYGRWSRADEVI